jgi:hypothetical protein
LHVRNSNFTDPYCSFRGYYSRKYYHDYHARKAYIETVVEKNGKMLTFLANEQITIQRAQNARDQQNHYDQFKSVTSNLHHLISTKSIPGIYKTPNQFEPTQTVFNVNIENHLKTMTRVRNCLKYSRKKIYICNSLTLRPPLH